MIGRRRLDTHFLAFTRMGAQISFDTGELEIHASNLRGDDIFLDEPSVTATENAIMAAVGARERRRFGTRPPSPTSRTCASS